MGGEFYVLMHVLLQPSAYALICLMSADYLYKKGVVVQAMCVYCELHGQARMR